jgi:hypothetical protein
LVAIKEELLCVLTPNGEFYHHLDVNQIVVARQQLAWGNGQAQLIAIGHREAKRHPADAIHGYALDAVNAPRQADIQAWIDRVDRTAQPQDDAALTWFNLSHAGPGRDGQAQDYQAR